MDRIGGAGLQGQESGGALGIVGIRQQRTEIDQLPSRDHGQESQVRPPDERKALHKSRVLAGESIPKHRQSDDQNRLGPAQGGEEEGERRQPSPSRVMLLPHPRVNRESQDSRKRRGLEPTAVPGGQGSAQGGPQGGPG